MVQARNEFIKSRGKRAWSAASTMFLTGFSGPLLPKALLERFRSPGWTLAGSGSSTTLFVEKELAGDHDGSVTLDTDLRSLQLLPDSYKSHRGEGDTNRPESDPTQYRTSGHLSEVFGDAPPSLSVPLTLPTPR